MRTRAGINKHISSRMISINTLELFLVRRPDISTILFTIWLNAKQGEIQNPKIP